MWVVVSDGILYGILATFHLLSVENIYLINKQQVANLY